MGIIDTILNPLIYMTSWIIVQFHTVFGAVFGPDNAWSWCLSIVCLTLVLRAAMIPLFVKQIKSMRNMQELQPRIKEIQKKYKLDKQRQQQEMMKLYKETGTNPLSSCLPILVQAPFWSALYRMLLHVADGEKTGVMTQSLVDSARHAKIIVSPLALKFLAGEGQVKSFGVSVLDVKLVTGVMILLMVATQFLTQRQLILKNQSTTQPNPMVQQQKLMMYFFPLFMLVIGINFPTGLLLYMLTTNVWTMGQQFYVIRNNPTPGSRAAEELEQRKKAKALRRAERKGEEPAATETDAIDSSASGGSANGATRTSPSGKPTTDANGSTGATPAEAASGSRSGQRNQPVRKPRSKRKR